MPQAIKVDVHRQILADVWEEKAALLERLKELEAVERFHAMRVGIPLRNHAGSGGTSVLNGTAAVSSAAKVPADMMVHDAAAFALTHLGRPSKIGEMADFLLTKGYGTKKKRRMFFNALYTALKRRDDLFEQIADARWKLKTQAGAKEE